MKDEILKLLKDKERVTLKEFYAAFPNAGLSTVRTALNSLVNDGSILRLERGIYGAKI